MSDFWMYSVNLGVLIRKDDYDQRSLVLKADLYDSLY